jgi:hypothetical protein
MQWTEIISEYGAGYILTLAGWIVWLAFTEDHLTLKQNAAYLLFCFCITYLTFKGISNIPLRGTVQLIIGIVSINLIYGLISGAKRSEKTVSDYFRDKVKSFLNSKSKEDEQGK